MLPEVPPPEQAANPQPQPPPAPEPPEATPEPVRPKPHAFVELPDWMEDMEGPEYVLMLTDKGWSEQDISLTFREFVALKRELAIMRGYPVKDDC